MVRDDRLLQPLPAPRWGLWIKGTSFLAVLAGVLALSSGDDKSNSGLLQALAPPMADRGQTHTGAVGPTEVKLFRDWPDQDPAVALVLTGQMHGYYHPCGCSRPQLGGLERRYNFVQLLKDKGWKVAPLDLGDVFEERSRRKPQYLVKYRKSMEAMDKIGYRAVGLGLFETEIPLLTALAEYALNHDSPKVLGTNLINRDRDFPGMVQPWTVTDGKDGAPRIGIASIIGPTVARQVPPSQNPPVQLGATLAELPKALKEFDAQRAELRVLLYHGTLDEAQACAARFPQLNVIVIPTKEDLPPEKPAKQGDTLIVGTGHKGRYLGVVGCFRNGPGFDLKYKLVAMGESYETPAGQDKDNPILAILEDYAKEVARDNYLARYPKTKHPIQLQFPDAHYVGSDECISCHRQSYEIWAKHRHAHAYQTLVDASRPGLRHLDGECVACHVVGFGHETGYQHSFKLNPDQTIKTLKESEHLRDVGCESCHGPGSAHIKDKKNKQIHDVMNPFRYVANETPEARRRRHNLIDRSCQQCHDQDNDVHWDFDKKWPDVVHPEKPRPNPF